MHKSGHMYIHLMYVGPKWWCEIRTHHTISTTFVFRSVHINLCPYCFCRILSHFKSQGRGGGWRISPSHWVKFSNKSIYVGSFFEYVSKLNWLIHINPSIIFLVHVHLKISDTSIFKSVHACKSVYTLSDRVKGWASRDGRLCKEK